MSKYFGHLGDAKFAIDHTKREAVIAERPAEYLTNPIPSTTFLFDRYRTGRLRYSLPSYDNLSIKWEFQLPSYPPRAPESTSAFDSSGNLYFGSHDGCIYSLTPNGKLRWMYHTERKVYASPAIHQNERLVITSGDGHCYCFSLDGQLLWRYHLASLAHVPSRWKRKLLQLWNQCFAYDRVLKQIWSNRCWSSPAISDDGIVYITGFGIGLHALRIDDGTPCWTYDLGFPWNHLAGVALDDIGNIYVSSQRGYVHSVTSAGKRRWRFAIRPGFDGWGNPSIDINKQTVYFSNSCQEHSAEIIALDLDGQLRWRTLLPSGVRGTVAIGYEDYVLVCGLDGQLRFLRKETGDVMLSVPLSTTSRALWTTCAIDSQGYILVTTKDSESTGRLVVLDKNGVIKASIPVGKALSTPVIDAVGQIYVGTWHGKMLCIADLQNEASR